MYDIQSTGGNLSILNIDDPLIRSELCREIRQAQIDPNKRDSDNWGWYEVQPGDVLYPELIAWKVYGLDTLKWVIMIAAGMDDPRERLSDGTKLFLPTAGYLRERIKHYAGIAEGVLSNG